MREFYKEIRLQTTIDGIIHFDLNSIVKKWTVSIYFDNFMKCVWHDKYSSFPNYVGHGSARTDIIEAEEGHGNEEKYIGGERVDIFYNMRKQMNVVCSVIRKGFSDREQAQKEKTIDLIISLSKMMNAAVGYAEYKEDVQEMRKMIDEMVDFLNKEIQRAEDADDYTTLCVTALASLMDTRAVYDHLEKAYHPNGMPARPI